MSEKKNQYTNGRNAENRISDIMTCTLARLIEDQETVFHGVSSHMPMIAMMLAKAVHAPNMIHLNIPGGINPKPPKISTYSSAGEELLKGASAFLPLAEVFDLSMRGRLDVAFLSGIQFDLQGNINASVIGNYYKPKVRMPGGAGSAVLIPTVKKAIIWRTKHDKRTFVPKVDFVTTRGNVYKIVTPLCVFAYKNGMLVLDSIHPTSNLEEVKENTGFELYYDEIRYTPLPTKEELATLKKIDPMDQRSQEFTL